MIEELQDQLRDIMFYVWLVMLVWCGVGDRGATGPAESVMFYVWLVMLVWCGVGDRGATGPAERRHVLRVACDAGVVWCR